MLVGYKLVDADGNAVNTWGGNWGYTPDAPNPLFIPTGDIVHAPSVGVDYNGYTLIEWHMDAAPAVVPSRITPRQVRLLLLQQGKLAEVEAMIAGQPEAVRITWEYALEFNRADPLLAQLAGQLGITGEQLDQFFIEAARL